MTEIHVNVRGLLVSNELVLPSIFFSFLISSSRRGQFCRERKLIILVAREYYGCFCYSALFIFHWCQVSECVGLARSGGSMRNL